MSWKSMPANVAPGAVCVTGALNCTLSGGSCTAAPVTSIVLSNVARPPGTDADSGIGSPGTGKKRLRVGIADHRHVIAPRRSVNVGAGHAIKIVVQSR